ncbi:MAG: class I SAM-dependent methyltransferase [Deltaproteobacteria bacterium]|nr:class I SAM-dependent methyltransferase [Deltaproteobacteria bacterium]
MGSDQIRWDKEFAGQEFTLGKKPNSFLKKHIHLLPRGKALDLAAGEGKNAAFLAKRGFHVEAVDISKAGLKKARRLAGKNGVKIQTHCVDLNSYRIEPGKYDLIVDFYFLNRRLIPRIKKGLKIGGRVVFETYTTAQSRLGAGGPHTLRYQLKSNELLKLFDGMRILFYREGIFREDGRLKAVASLIAEKK